ncbi:MAG: hypothetical protein AB7D29_07650 [Campylobacterales bacterium]
MNLKRDFIGHEITDNDKLWIIAPNLDRIEAYRIGDMVIPVDMTRRHLMQTLKEGKNSRVDLRLCWLDNYSRKQMRTIK